jgi:hypothetical protein
MNTGDRRYNGGRVYRRPVNRHQVSKREDHIFAVVFTFIVGAMLGAVITLGAITSGVLVL